MNNESAVYLADARNCSLYPESVGIYSALAGLRMVTSLLSVIGAFSIIVLVLVKRQVMSQKVHPIFMLSIGDLLLALMWVIGGAIWFHQHIKHRSICLFVTLLTVILECVTVNLTLVYALYAHAYMKKTSLNSITNSNHPDHGWPKLKVFLIYLTAWIVPVLLVIVPVVRASNFSDLIKNANSCTCWCLPEFANIVPIASDRMESNNSNSYILDIRKAGITSTAVIVAHYVIVFPLLVLYYVKILNRIKRIKQNNRDASGSHFYGATGTLLVHAHSRAKQRVTLFLSVFILTGFCNLVLAFLLMIHMSVQLAEGHDKYSRSSPLDKSKKTILFLQSLTVPLQGFLNAIVYGWSREDFLYVVASTTPYGFDDHSGNDVNTVEHDRVSPDLESSSLFTDSESSVCYRHPHTPLLDDFN